MVFGGGSRRLEVLLELRDKFSAGMKTAGSRLDDFNDRLKTARPLLIGITGAVGGVGAASVKLASDLEEARNKANVTFGEASQIVQDFAATSARSFGISQRAANEYTATLGNILQASGLSERATAQMSVELTRLAADLASFNNIPIEEALLKLRSGLVGQAEPLRTVGVLLSEAAVQTKALELGLAKNADELTEGAKVAARYALIIEQTGNAQGDFTRTSESLANQMRIAKAQMEDAAATLGTQLIPHVTRALEVINGLIARFASLPQDVRTAILAFGGVAAALAAIGLVIPPLIAGIRSIIAVLGALRIAFSTVLGPIAAFIAAGFAAKAMAEALLNALDNLFLGTEKETSAWKIAQRDLRDLTSVMSEWLTQTLDTIQPVEAAGNAVSGLTDEVGDMEGAMRRASELIANGLTPSVKKATEEIRAQSRDVPSLDQKLRDLSETTRNTTFLQERIMGLYEKTAAQLSIYEGAASLAAESVWNIGQATRESAIPGLEELREAIALDTAEIAKFSDAARTALNDALQNTGQLVAGMSVLGGVVTSVTNGIANIRGPNGATSGAFAMAPFPWELRDIAPPGVAVAAGPSIINVTVQGSVTTSDLTAIIARELREIERRGM